MPPKPTDQLAVAISYARDFSIENKIYYIDSMIILLMLLETDDFALPISQDDRVALVQSVRAHNWTRIERGSFRKREGIPLTVDAELLIRGAAKLQQLLSHKRLQAEHVMLVLLSVQGQPREQLEKAGLIFEDYLQVLEGEWQTKTGLHTGSAARRPQRKTPYSKWALLLRPRGRKMKSAAFLMSEAHYFFVYNQLRLSRNYCWYSLQMNPGNADAYGLCAVSWMQERMYEEAVPHLIKALALDPGNSYAKIYLAMCYQKMGEFDRAEEIYKALVMQLPDDLYILNNAGFFYAETGRPHEAIIYLDKAISLGNNDTNAFPLNNKGYALTQLGRLEEASAYITQSLKLHKSNAYAYRNLALLHLKEDNRTAAKAALLQAQRFRFATVYGPEVDELLAGLEGT